MAPAPAPTLPSATASAGRGRRGAIAAVGARPHLGLAAEAEVHEDRRRHDRHLRVGDLEADLALVEIAHHAAGGVEAEGAAARQHDRVDALDAVRRIEQLDVARAGRAAAHVDAGDDAVGAGQDHGAAGRPLGQRVVADRQAGDGGEALRRAQSRAGPGAGACAARTPARASAPSPVDAAASLPIMAARSYHDSPMTHLTLLAVFAVAQIGLGLYIGRRVSRDERVLRRRPAAVGADAVRDAARRQHRRRVDDRRRQLRLPRRAVGLVVGRIGGDGLGGARSVGRAAHPPHRRRTRPADARRLPRVALRLARPRHQQRAALGRHDRDPRRPAPGSVADARGRGRLAALDRRRPRRLRRGRSTSPPAACDRRCG